MSEEALMTGIVDEYVRGQLVDRRHKLAHAMAGSTQSNQLGSLLEEVDSALAKFEDGTFGICERCHEPIERDRLIADPLVRFCVDHLTAKQRIALEQDLQLAARIQRGLLPSNDVSRDGWRIAYHYDPAGVVSGDYCDVVAAADGGLYMMLGDVSGKGVAASMLMAHLHAMFRTLVSAALPLKAMVEQASRIFRESTLPTHYATLVCGRVRSAGEVEICNAGHPPPLVIRGGEVTELDANGPPVGMFRNEEFSVSEMRLERGDSIVIYSDGISEATDDLGLVYGAERLRALIARQRELGPSAVVEACREDLAHFRRGAQKLDDVTVMVAGRA